MKKFKIFELVPKAIIWFCLAVIVFSPLYVNSHLFFPFIVTKTMAFNVAVEIMFLAFLLLGLIKPEYRIRFNKVVLLMGAYLLLSFVSALVGSDFYHSFWSNNERSEGLFLFIHLFLLVVVLTSFFRQMKEWLYIFEAFFCSSFLVALVALGQYLNLSWLFASSGGQRLAGTIGNAGYMAGFLLFAVFTGLFLIFQRKYWPLRVYYGVVIALQIFIILNTFTRGGIIALFISAFIFSLYLSFVYFKDKRLKILGGSIIVLSLAFVALIFFGSDLPIVKNNDVLRRLSTISSESVTAQNRLWTWQSAWQGFLEKPLLGWGPENFYQPFDKYFNPQIFRHVGSVIWYDRAHNMILDRLVIGGIIGLISYLALLFWPLVELWRGSIRKEGQDKKYLMPVIFSLIMLGYLIQNLFIFEALVTYVPLFISLCFIGLFGKGYDWRFLTDIRFKKIILIIAVIIVGLSLNFGIIRPLEANVTVTRALSGNASDVLSLDQRIALWDTALSRNTAGNQEYRRQLFNFFQDVINTQNVDPAALAKLRDMTEREVKKLYTENPNNVGNVLVLMRFNNLMLGATGQSQYLNDNLVLFQQAKKLAPQRQHIYLEMGYSHTTLSGNLKNNKQKDAAQKELKEAVPFFEHAWDLNRANFEPYRQLAYIYLMSGENDKLQILLANPDAAKDKFNPVDFFVSLTGAAIQNENYQAAVILIGELIKINPDNPQYYAQEALAYAYLGDNAKALELAKKVASFGPEQKKLSEDFIKKLNQGEFKK